MTEPTVDHQALLRELRATHPDALLHLPDDGAPFLSIDADHVDGAPAVVARWRNSDGSEHSHHVTFDPSLPSERIEPMIDADGAPVMMTADDGSQAPVMHVVPTGAINSHEKAWHLLVEQVHAHFTAGAPVSEKGGPVPVDPRRNHALQRLLRTHPRVAIVGGPKTGKTTLSSAATDRPVLHSDDTVTMPWPAALAAIRDKCEPNQRFCLEGIQAARAITEGVAVDAVLWLDKPRAEMTPEQVAQANAITATLSTWAESTPSAVVVRPDVVVTKAT